MSDPRQTSTFTAGGPFRPLVVGVVYSEETLGAATALGKSPGGPDLLELRVDHFAESPDRLAALALRCASRPLIVTVRHPEEGGAGHLDVSQRLALFERFHGNATFLDIEVRSLREDAELQALAARTRERGGGLIASFHDFSGMPTVNELRALADAAVAVGAQLFKVAAMARDPADLAVLLQFQAAERRLPLALMGMGTMGKISRLTLAAGGSVLNYGFLGSSEQVSGQWPAALLRQRIDELLSGDVLSTAQQTMERLLKS